VNVLLNAGAGVLSAPASFPAVDPGCGGACGPDSVATGDVNADGHPDVIVSHSGGVYVLLGACSP
jgi:hypothetical protein